MKTQMALTGTNAYKLTELHSTVLCLSISCISNKFKVVNKISNITAFNTDEFNTWKSAFRECVKLASKVIDGQVDEETEIRRDTVD